MSFSSSLNSFNYGSSRGDYAPQQSIHHTQSHSSPAEQSASRSNSLYMGDLDPSWDENAIRAVWANLGEPNVQVKLIRNSGSTGGSSGYCFVEFPSHLNASNALLKNGLLIPNARNRYLKLNWASFATAPGNEHSVFVGDIAPNVSEAQLFELFISRYASTLNAKIVFDQMTGVSKGYGFVKFGQESEQQRALLEMQGVFLNGRAVRVSTTSKNRSKFQQPLQQQQQPYMQQQQPYVQQQARAPAFNNGNVQSQFIYPVQQQPTLTQYTDPNNTTVFIGGLSSLVSEDELRAYFQPFGSIVYVKIPVGKGCGFVQYVDRISAETAIAKMQGYPIGNSRIRLSWGRSAKQAAVMQQAFASSAQHRQQLSNQNALSTTNLPYNRQPAMPVSYGYSGNWDLLNGGCSYKPSSPAHYANSVHDATGGSSTVLLPGVSNLEYVGAPSNSSSTSTFSYSPSYSASQSTTYSTSSQATDPVSAALGYGAQVHPQFLVQGNDAFDKSKSETIDRLERGSNGFIFA